MQQTTLIQSQIAKKESEIAGLERKLEAAKVYLQALRDILRALEKEQIESEAAEGTIREGSTVDQARKAILTAGKPLHLEAILLAIGKGVSRETKASLNGSLAAYVRKGEVFCRPAPSTYGLLELDSRDDRSPESEPPVGFGDFDSEEDDDIPF